MSKYRYSGAQGRQLSLTLRMSDQTHQRYHKHQKEHEQWRQHIKTLLPSSSLSLSSLSLSSLSSLSLRSSTLQSSQSLGNFSIHERKYGGHSFCRGGLRQLDAQTRSDTELLAMEHGKHKMTTPQAHAIVACEFEIQVDHRWHIYIYIYICIYISV